MKLLPLSTFKTLAGVAGTSDDTLLALLLDYVSGRIERHLNRTLTYAQYTETFKPIGRTYFVKAYPIDTGQSLTLVDYQTTVSSSDFQVSADRGKIELKWREWFHLSDSDFESCSVTYYGGFQSSGSGDEAALQSYDRWRLATYLQTHYLFKNRQELGLTSLSLGGGSIALAPAKLLPEVESILSEDRRWSL